MSLVGCKFAADTSAINRYFDKLKDGKALEGAVKKVAFGVYGDVKSATPVDTGRARNGWNINQNSPTSYSIGNNVHYVPFLEFGTRRSQAHAGFIRGTLAAWRPKALRIVKAAMK
jgi:HK97 gp10 family phage protein